MPPLRVGLDLTSTERSRLTGWERFALGLESALSAFPPNDFKLVPLRIGRPSGGRWRTTARQATWHLSGLRRSARAEDIDVVHAPTFPPGRVDRPLVWTIHDDLMLGGHREHARLGATIWRPLARRTLTYADLLVTGTQAMAADLRERGAPPDRLRVITPGISPLPSDGVVPVVRRLNDGVRVPLPAQFILAVGTMEARKQPEVAFRTASSLGLPLVWAGRRDPSQRDWQPAIPGALTTGVVTDSELAWLYRNAVAFLTASAYEGLDFPLLEARSAGLPVAASDIPVHREMGDGGCCFFPVGDVGEASAALEQALSLRPGAATLPTWSDCASQYMTAYREATELHFS